MKCRDCEKWGWGDDEGTPVWGWCWKYTSCPDPDIDRSCPDFSPKKPDIFTTLSTLQAENKKLRAELKSKVDLVFQQAKELDRRHLLLQEQEAELERVKRALAMMWFAYVNSDKETPHSYETDALEEAEHILGPWAKCMPKYLRRGPEEG